jgi:hypothetical protein
MRDIPYHDNPNNACALACYTMVAKFLLPEENVTFEELGIISDWKSGYVVWAFNAWNYLLGKNISIIDYDSYDYRLMVKKGFDALQESVPPKEFDYIKSNTFEPNSLIDSISLCLDNESFTYVQRKPNWDDVLREFSKPGICDITLNSSILNNKEGFVGHRVVLIDISSTHITFHDPNLDGSGAYRKEAIELFRKAFEDNPELTRYSLK